MKVVFLAFIYWFMSSSVAYLQELPFTLHEWKFKSKVKTFVQFLDAKQYKDLLISLACVSEENKKIIIKPSCVTKLYSIKLKVRDLKPEDLKNGKNPGAVACSKVLGGKVRFASDINGNQKTFCQLNEKFFINNQWITKAYAQTKK